MDAIDEFLSRYSREYDYYQRVATLASRQLEGALQAAGIRSIVTARAKNPRRLEDKCRRRSEEKNYSSAEDIANDIVDLAGVRVALYFPGDREKVGALVEKVFVALRGAKHFPESSPPRPKKRFSGYSATHYLVRLRSAGSGETDSRYLEARIEVQVASVLMHAWAEVEHDLVYKPESGALSEDEFATLDEINGLVLSGEIALERLQRAGERRIAEQAHRFSNHFELAAFLASQLSGERSLGDADLGRMDILYKFLLRCGIDTPKALSPYLDSLDSDFERRPIADQISDHLLTEDESRYRVYEAVREEVDANSVPEETRSPSSGLLDFLHEWALIERTLADVVGPLGLDLSKMSISAAVNHLFEREMISSEAADDLMVLRRIRNNIVHGREPVSDEELANLNRRLRRLHARLRRLTNS